jgi:hypothetical protein
MLLPGVALSDVHSLQHLLRRQISSHPSVAIVPGGSVQTSAPLSEMIGMKFGGVRAVWRRHWEVVRLARKRRKTILKVIAMVCVNIIAKVDRNKDALSRKSKDFAQTN